MGQTIRQAEKRDQEAIVQCVQAAYFKYIERIGKRPAPMLADYATLITQKVVSVLVDDEEIRAILVMWPQDGYLFIDNIAVDPRFQGQGLGQRLIAFVEQQAREVHLNAICLYTNVLMKENRLFYHKLGFEEESHHVQNGYHRVFLWKRLIQV